MRDVIKITARCSEHEGDARSETQEREKECELTMIMSDFPSRWPNEGAEKYILVHSGYRRLCVHARKLRMAESLARITRRQYGKPRGLYIAARRYYTARPRFIYLLSEWLCLHRRILVKRADIRVCVCSVLAHVAFRYVLSCRSPINIALACARDYAMGLMGAVFMVLCFIVLKSCGRSVHM